MNKPVANYHVALASLKQTFPKRFPVPALLKGFGAHLATLPHGSLGYFDALAGEALPDGLVEDEVALKPLQDALGIFLKLPDGSFVALWNHTEDTPPAVVLLGSEGELKNVAPTLEAFLLAWAKGKTKIGELDDDGADKAQRKALSAWLTKRTVVEKKGETAPVVPKFSPWFKSVAKEAIKARDTALKASLKGQPKAKREKVALAPPEVAARNALTIGERALSLLGRRSDDPEIIALFAGLGVDLAAVKKPDHFRAIELPELGLEFELDFEWEFDDAIPKSERAALKAANVRVIGKLRFTNQGYMTKSSVMKKELTFSAYQGALPWDVSFADRKDTLDQKLGFTSKVIGNQLSWTDKAARRRTLMKLDEEPNTTIQYVLVRYAA